MPEMYVVIKAGLVFHVCRVVKLSVYQQVQYLGTLVSMSWLGAAWMDGCSLPSIVRARDLYCEG